VIHRPHQLDPNKNRENSSDSEMKKHHRNHLIIHPQLNVKELNAQNFRRCRAHKGRKLIVVLVPDQCPPANVKSSSNQLAHERLRIVSKLSHQQSTFIATRIFTNSKFRRSDRICIDNCPSSPKTLRPSSPGPESVCVAK
jgi:hypothetical protein